MAAKVGREIGYENGKWKWEMGISKPLSLYNRSRFNWMIMVFRISQYGETVSIIIDPTLSK